MNGTEKITQAQLRALLATGERAANRAFAAAKAERAAEVPSIAESVLLGSDGALLCACGDSRAEHPDDGACSLNGLGHGMPSNEPLNKCMAYRPFGDKSLKMADRLSVSRKARKNQPAAQKTRKPTSGESVRLEIRAGAVESEVQSAICALLDAYHIPYAVTDAAEVYNRRGQRIQRLTPGWPDVTACADAQFVGIECKRAKGGRLSYEQAATLDRLDKAGALIIIARSVDDVIEVLDRGYASEATRAEIAAALKRGPKLRKGKR